MRSLKTIVSIIAYDEDNATFIVYCSPFLSLFLQYFDMLYMAYPTSLKLRRTGFLKIEKGKYALKILYYVGSSEKDLKELPEDTIDAFVYGLSIAQKGGKSPKGKVLQGFGGADVIELIDRDADGTYRAVYTVRMSEVIFVLHVFQKKSKHGIATPKQDIDLIKSRLKRAQEIYKESFK